MLAPIRRMVDAIGPGHRAQIARVHAFDAGGIDAVFVRVRAALVVGVDAAGPAKIVFRGFRAPLVERQVVRAFNDPDSIERCGQRNRFT